MAYVRSKRIKGHTYYYLVEGYRDGTKVKQRVLEYLGSAAPTAKQIAKAKAAHASNKKTRKPQHKPKDEWQVVRDNIYDIYHALSLEVRHNIRQNSGVSGSVVIRDYIPVAVCLKKTPDIDTMIHELGHVIDYKVRNRSHVLREEDARFDHIFDEDRESSLLRAEADELARRKYVFEDIELFNLRTKLDQEGQLTQREQLQLAQLETFFDEYASTLNEGFANAFEFYIRDRNAAAEIAPNFYNLISTLTSDHPDIKKMLEELSATTERVGYKYY